jgi:hypothetical protein
MATKIQMSWSGDEKIMNFVKETDAQVKRVITGQFMYHSDLATAHAKVNAPWTDQTGNARSGLNSGVSIGLNQDFWELYVAHSVFYGIYLETRFSGKYQIIAPTILFIGKLIIDRMSSAFDKMGIGYTYE